MSAAQRGILVPTLDERGQLLHQLGREGVTGVGAVEAGQADGAALLREDEVHGTSAFTPVTARPMISFWIWEVPSYNVVTRASRR
jgi:hypothetical protein